MPGIQPLRPVELLFVEPLGLLTQLRPREAQTKQQILKTSTNHIFVVKSLFVVLPISNRFGNSGWIQTDLTLHNAIIISRLLHFRHLRTWSCKFLFVLKWCLFCNFAFTLVLGENLLTKDAYRLSKHDRTYRPIFAQNIKS